MYENDYIMKMIHESVRMVMRLVFHKDDFPQEDFTLTDLLSGPDYDKLQTLADSGKINEAENLLYEQLDDSDEEDLEGALLFYEYLNQKSNEELEDADYSREEISDGIKMVLKMYGHESLTELTDSRW